MDASPTTRTPAIRFAKKTDWDFVEASMRTKGIVEGSAFWDVVHDIVKMGCNLKREYPSPTHVLVMQGRGYCAFTTDPLDPDPSACPVTICGLFVASNDRRKGVGTALVRRVEKLMITRGRLTFNVMAEPSSVNFWHAQQYLHGGVVISGCKHMHKNVSPPLSPRPGRIDCSGQN